MPLLSLKERLFNFLQRKEGWVSSGEMQRMVVEKTKYTPSNCSRRLRELENENKIEVEYRKGHAWYRIK